jgi:hypothetical protein
MWSGLLLSGVAGLQICRYEVSCESFLDVQAFAINLQCASCSMLQRQGAAKLSSAARNADLCANIPPCIRVHQ